MEKYAEMEALKFISFDYYSQNMKLNNNFFNVLPTVTTVVYILFSYRE